MAGQSAEWALFPQDGHHFSLTVKDTSNIPRLR